jgi:hypothetical protein
MQSSVMQSSVMQSSVMQSSVMQCILVILFSCHYTEDFNFPDPLAMNIHTSLVLHIFLNPGNITTDTLHQYVALIGHLGTNVHFEITVY